MKFTHDVLISSVQKKSPASQKCSSLLIISTFLHIRIKSSEFTQLIHRNLLAPGPKFIVNLKLTMSTVLNMCSPMNCSLKQQKFLFSLNYSLSNSCQHVEMEIAVTFVSFLNQVKTIALDFPTQKPNIQKHNVWAFKKKQHRKILEKLWLALDTCSLFIVNTISFLLQYDMII